MAKCSTIPQVFNSTGYVDSTLFTTLNNQLKSNGLKGVELRTKTKELYNSYNSESFKSVFGDWKLLQRVKFGTMNTLDIAKFNKLYNGDINILESSITPVLDELYEPSKISISSKEVFTTSNIDEITNTNLVQFDSKLQLDELATSLNITSDNLISNILANKTIFIKLENVYYTSQITPRVALISNSILASQGSMFSSKDNVLFDNQMLDVSTRKASILGSEYDSATTQFASKLVASIILKDYDKFQLIFDKKQKGLSTELQQRTIDLFIKTKISEFRDNLVTTWQKELSGNNSAETNKKYANKINDLKAEYDLLLERLFTVNKNNTRPFIYDAMLVQLQKYGIHINSVDSIVEVDDFDDNGNEIKTEISRAQYGGAAALKIDQKRNVMQEIKFVLSQHMNTAALESIINTNDLESRFGVSEPVTIDDVWNLFISTVTTNTTREQKISTLESVNQNQLGGVLTSFIELLKTNEAIWNGFYASTNLPVTISKTMTIFTKPDGSITLGGTQNNYNSKAENISYESLVSRTQITFENTPNYLEDILSSTPKHGFNRTDSIAKNIESTNFNNRTILEKYEWIQDRLSKLKLESVISMKDILQAIQLKTGKTLATDKDSFISQLEDSQLSELYRSEFSFIMDKLNYITQDLVTMKYGSKFVPAYKNLKEDAKLKYKFQKYFKEQGSFRELANYNALKYFNAINLSYSNANREMEWSAHKPSYWTDFAKVITPTNGTIDQAAAELYFKDFTNSPILEHNDFLWNHSGIGLFDFKVDESGKQQVSGVNGEFLKNLRTESYSGLQNKNNGVGLAYDKITDLTSDLIAVANSLKGIWATPSSDSTASYLIQNAKFGLKHFLTDENGMFISYKNLLNEIGWVDKLGNVVAKSESEITDDTKFYFPLLVKNGIYRDGSIKSIRDLKNILNDDTQINNTIKATTKSVIEAFNNNAQSNILYNHTEYKDKTKLLDIEHMSNGAYKYLSIVNSPAVNELISNNLESNNPDTYEKALSDIYRYLLNLPKQDTISKNKEFISKFYDNTMLYLPSMSGITPFLPFELVFNNGVRDSIIHAADLITLKSNVQSYLDNPAKLIANNHELRKAYEQNYKSSKPIAALKRTIMGEVVSMQIASKGMLQYQYAFTESGTRYVKSISLQDGIQEKGDAGTLHNVRDFNGKFTKSKYNDNNNGKETKGKAIILDKGLPTGQVFKFLRMSFNSNGKKITLEDYAKKYLGSESTQLDLIALVNRLTKETHPIIINSKTDSDGNYSNIIPVNEYNKLSTEQKASYMTAKLLNEDIELAKTVFDNIVYEFIDGYIENNQKYMIDNTQGIAKDLMMMITDTIPPYVPGTSELEINKGKTGANIISTHKTILTLEEQDNNDSTKQDDYSRTKDKEVIAQYNKAMMESFINDYITSINVGEDLLYGRQYEYKHFDDINKRVSEIIRSGITNMDTETYSSVTVEDVWTASNMIDELSNGKGLSKEFLMAQYGDAIEVGNGLSFITVEEFIKRAKSTNHYKGMKKYINALTDPKTALNPSDFYTIVEQLKYFMYSRQTETNGLFAGNVSSYQEKNSTMVLFPKLFIGTKLEVLTQFMNDNKIDQINFKSSSKLSVPTFRLHDIFTKVDTETGNRISTGYELRTKEVNGVQTIDTTINGKPVNMQDYVIRFKRNNLRIQQEQVSHTMEKRGKISTQANKKTDVNLNNDSIFEVNGVSYKGRTNNYEEGKRGLFENRHAALHHILAEGRDRLIYSFGAMKNGKILHDGKGDILIDTDKVRQIIRRYYANNEDISLMEAFSAMENSNDKLMSLNHPTIKGVIENILQASITNSNVNLELPQIHGTILPDVFMQPINYKYGEKDIEGFDSINEYRTKGMMSMTDEFIAEQQDKLNWELRAERPDPNNPSKNLPAEIVLNIWDSRFDKYATYEYVTDNKGVVNKIRKIDINKIPKESRTVYATRIPHEGMQSSFVAEVVGFMNNSSSQIMVPKHLSKRTGWDYDIDTIYIYTRHLYERADGQLYPISYEYDINPKNKDIHNTETNKRINYVKTYFLNEYNNLELSRKALIFKARDEYKSKLEDLHDDALNTTRDVLDEIRDNPNDSKYKEVISKIRDITQDYTSNIVDVVDKYDNALDDTYNKEYDEFLLELQDAIERTLDPSNKTTIKDFLESKDLTSAQTKNLLFLLAKEKSVGNKVLTEDLNNQIESINNDYDNKVSDFLMSKEVSNGYNQLPVLQQMTKETRENMIIDSLMARVISEDSNIFREKVNEFNNISKVSQGINNEMGISNSTLNFTNILDRNRITSLNKTVAELKGIVIASQNTYSLLGVVNANVSNEFAIPIVITESEMPTGDIHEHRKVLNELIGDENKSWLYQPATETSEARYVVFNSHLANNKSNSWKNIQGQYITEQSSEIAANVLDAVKEKMGHNINGTTSGVLDLLANVPVSHNTNLYSKDNSRTPNSFAYSNLIIHQPIVSKFISLINESKRSDSYADKNKAYRNIVNSTRVSILNSLNSISLFTGKLTTNPQAISILDLFIHKTSVTVSNSSNNPEDIKSRAISTKVDKWKKAMINGEQIFMYDTTGISTDIVFSELIKFAKDTDNIKANVYSLINDISDADTQLQIETLFEENQSQIQSLFDNLKVSEFTNNSVFTTDKGKIKITDENAYKSIDELHNIYTSSIKNGTYNMDITQHENTKSVIDYVNFLDEQISIFKLYQQYDKTSNLITKSSLVLRTDKLGTSPDSYTTIKLISDMANLYIDYSEFESQLTEAGFSIKEKQNIKYLYDSTNSLSGKEEILKEIIEEYNSIFKIGEHEDSELRKGKFTINSNSDIKNFAQVKLSIPKSGLKVGDKTLMESVFPNVVKGTLADDYDFTKSSLPYFESQFVNNYHFSTKLFSKILLSSNPNMNALVTGIVAELGLSGNMYSKSSKNIYKRILDTVIAEHIYDSVPFFNGNSNSPLMRSIERLRVVGKVVPVENAVRDGQTTTPTSSIFSDIKVDTQNLSLQEYRNLSVANQVYLLKNHINNFTSKYNINDKNNITDLLELFDPKLEKNNLLKNGYHKLDMSNTSKDIAKLQQTFRNMFFNENPFLRQTARDLVRYSFYFNGLAWGINVSKIIDPSLFTTKSKEYDIISAQVESEKNNPYAYNTFSEEDNLEHNRLYKTNEALLDLESKYEQMNDDELDKDSIELWTKHLKSQLHGDKSISPVVNKFGNALALGFNSGIYAAKAYPIIVQELEANDTSYISRYKYVSTTIPEISNTKVMVLERYDIPGSTNVYYFPVTKSLPYEFATQDEQTQDSTVIAKYKGDNESEQYYKDLIHIYDNSQTKSEPRKSSLLYNVVESKTTNFLGETVNKDVYTYNNLITKSNKSHSETAKDIIDSVDRVIYIGENSIYKSNFKSDKTIYTTLDKLNHEFFKTINLTEDDNIAIVGDSISDSKYTQEQYDTAIIPFVRNMSMLYRFDSIKTIFKMGVGESIYKANITSNKSNEYIEIGMKDNVRRSSILDQSHLTKNIINASTMDINNFREKQLEIASIAKTLFDELKRENNTRPDQFSLAITDMQNTLERMTETDNQLNAIDDAMASNIQLLHKIIEYIETDFIQFNKPNGTIEHVNVLQLQIGKYMNSNNAGYKSQIAAKLYDYKKMFYAADKILAISNINVPKITSDEYKLLDEENKIEVDKLFKWIKAFNRNIENIRLDIPRDGSGNPIYNSPAYPEDIKTGKAIDYLNTAISAKVQEYMAHIVFPYSRNGKYNNLTRYGKIKEYNESLDTIPDAKLSTDLSPEELSDLYIRVMQYNDDITTTQSLLDSMGQTGVGLLDNSMFMMSEIRLEVQGKRNDRIVQLQDMLKKYEDTLKQGTKLEYNKSRESYIRGKFVNHRTGNLLSEYDWKKVDEDIKMFNAAKSKYIDVAQLYKAERGYASEITLKYDYVFKGSNIGDTFSPFSVAKKSTIDTTSYPTTYIENSIGRMKQLSKEQLQGFLQDSKFVDASLDNNFNYYKLVTIESEGSSHNVILKLDKSDDYTNKDLNSKSNNVLIQVDNEFVGIKDLYAKTASHYAKDIDSLDENKLGYYENIDRQNPDGSDNEMYKQIMQVYISQSLWANKELKTKFEKRHHIVIKDGDLISKFDTKSYYKTISYMYNTPEFTGITIQKVIPISKYESAEYSVLSEQEKLFLRDTKKLIQNIVAEVFPDKIFDEDFTPYVFMSTSHSIGDIFKKFIGWTNIQEEHIETDVFNNKRWFYQSRYVTAPDVKHIINIRYKTHEESQKEYQVDVVNKANEKLQEFKNKGVEVGVEHFDRLEDVLAYNAVVKEKFAAKMQNKMNYDVPSVLNALIEELYNIKSYSDFKQIYNLVRNEVGSENFKARVRDSAGKDYLDKTRTMLSNTLKNKDIVYATKSGKDTQTYKSYNKFDEVISLKSNTSNLFDQILGSGMRITSMNTMWFNFHSGVKNVSKGMADLFIEYQGGEYANRKEFGKGFNTYMSNISSIIANVHNNDPNAMPNQFVAIIKRMSDIYHDHTEGAIDRETRGSASKFIDVADMLAYMPTITGEHMLQYTTLFTLMHSHRFVDGAIMSREEFIGDVKYQIYKEILPTKLLESLDGFIKTEKAKSKDKFSYTDHTKVWAEMNHRSIPKEVIAKFNEIYDTSRKEASNKFDTKYTKVLDMYKFEETGEGIGKLVVDPLITSQVEAYFIDRVKYLNQSIHGIYNTLDKGALQATMLGQVAFQFRKWMRPTWIRYMGVKYSINPLARGTNQPHDEALNHYRSGAFTDTMKFFKQPFLAEYYKAKDAHIKNPALKAFVDIFKAYGDFFHNYKFLYNNLSPVERANLKRTAYMFVNLTVITGLLFLVGKGYDPDDEDDSVLKPYSSLVNLVSGLQTEYVDMLPYYGWAKFYKRTKQSTVPMERQIGSISNLIYDTFAYPWRDESERVYSRGMYAGQSKIGIDIEKSIPGYRQWHKQVYLNSSISYYGMYNPIVNAAQ